MSPINEPNATGFWAKFPADTDGTALAAGRAAAREWARAFGLTLEQAAKLSETYFPMPDDADGRP